MAGNVRWHHRQVHRFTEHAPEKPLALAHDLVHVEITRGHRLLAAEREQLSRQPRRAFRGGTNLTDIGADLRRRVIEVQLEQVEISENAREEVVEVVRDAAGEVSEAFESLRLPEILFEAVLRRDVEIDAAPRPASVRQRFGDRKRVDACDGAVASPHAELQIHGKAVQQARPEVLPHGIAILVDDMRERRAGVPERGGVEAEELAHAGAVLEAYRCSIRRGLPEEDDARHAARDELQRAVRDDVRRQRVRRDKRGFDDARHRFLCEGSQYGQWIVLARRAETVARRAPDERRAG